MWLVRNVRRRAKCFYEAVHSHRRQADRTAFAGCRGVALAYAARHLPVQANLAGTVVS
jgi:hypothetical protein